MRIVVTGASGFCGRPVCRALKAAGHHVTAVVRKAEAAPELAADSVVVLGDFTPATDWSDTLADAEAVVHLAADTALPKNSTTSAEMAFRQINVGVTRALAEAALRAGARRFVFASSIKVNGDTTEHGAPFSAESPTCPADLYAKTKVEAEAQLMELASHGLEPVILRPPLMYGPGVKGNFALLFRLAERGVPLPIGSIRNSRDLLAVDAFAGLVECAVRHPAAAKGVFVARDGAPVSTPELYTAIGRAIGKPVRMWPMPATALRLMGKVAGASREIDRLIGNLEIDDVATREQLQWKPPIGMEAMLRVTAEWWQSERASATRVGPGSRTPRASCPPERTGAPPAL